MGIRNTLIITWNETMLSGSLCVAPKVEYFKYVKTEEIARRIVGRKVTENINSAVWNGVNIVSQPVKVVAPIAKAESIPITKEPEKKQRFFDKAINSVRNIFKGGKLFSRQKH